MKKFKVIIPILAVFVAVVAAFATPPVSDYRKHQAGIGCVDQTECTLNTGNMCNFTPLNASCQAASWRKP